MYQLAAAEVNQNSEITSSFSKALKKAGQLRVNEAKCGTENDFNNDDVGFTIRIQSKYFENTLFGVSPQNLDLYFNPYTTDNVDIRFSATV